MRNIHPVHHVRKHTEARTTGTENVKCQRVLIFSFFSGILSRGIPLYVANLCRGFEESGIRPRQFQCPRVFRRLPRPVLNLLFVFTEQMVVPLFGLAYDKVIYASNSVSILGSLSSRTAMVVHDFIPFRKKNRSFAAQYIRATQHAHALMGRDVVYVSRSTERVANRIRKFSRSRSFLFPNAFYRFLELQEDEPQQRSDHVLLCSGWGANKDLPGALQLYLQSELYRDRPLYILGLAGRTSAVEEFCRNNPAVKDRIIALAELSDREVLKSYEQAAWVWVHSRKEGYGRSVAEARLCGRAVVASAIAPFREQQDPYTYFYFDVESFESAIARCENAKETATKRSPVEHDLLLAEIQRYCRT